MNKLVKFFLILILIAVILVACLDLFSNNPHKAGFFVISRGDNVLQIASNLQNQGYIGSRIIFVFDSVKMGDARKMKAGRYQIIKDSTDSDLVNEFTKFKSTPVNILIAPGKTTQDVAQILSENNLANKSQFLSLVLNTSNSPADFYSQLVQKYSFLADKPKDAGLEGYLFPDNYLIDAQASNQEIVRQILDNFDRKLTADERQEIKTQKRTIFDVVTLASILEKEVKTYNDKQVVAGILLKRINYNLPLEVDSTLLYFQTSAHPSAIDKDVDSPYNTYRHAGLPVGPICNPGQESIMAAINPKNSDYWFYLSAPDGETIFAKTLGQHLINKAKYLP